MSFDHFHYFVHFIVMKGVCYQMLDLSEILDSFIYLPIVEMKSNFH